MRASLRLDALRAIDKMEHLSTRKVGFSELKQILLSEIVKKTAKDYIRLLFDSRNKRFYQILFPVVADTVLRFPSVDFTRELLSWMTQLVAKSTWHESAADICTDLFLNGTPMLFLENILKSPVSVPLQRRGVGVCLLKMASMSLSKGFDEGSSWLSDFLTKLIVTDYWIDIKTEMFACTAMLLPVHAQKFMEILVALLIECIDCLDSKCITNLSRQLASSACNLLITTAQFFDKKPDIASFSEQVLSVVSRDNPRLLSAARRNPKLIDQIKLVRNLWESLAVKSEKTSESHSILRKSLSCKQILESLVSESLDFGACDFNGESDLKMLDSPCKGSESNRENSVIDYSDCVDELDEIRDSGNDADFAFFIETYTAREIWTRISSELCGWLFHVLVDMLGSSNSMQRQIPCILDWISASRVVTGIEEIVSATDLINLFRYLQVLQETCHADQATEMLQYFYSS